MFDYIWVSTNFLLQRLSHGFLSKTFCLTLPKKFVGYPSLFHRISGIEKISGEEVVGGVSGVSVEKFLSHFAEKIRRRTH